MSATASLRLRRVPPPLPPFAIAAFALVLAAVLSVAGDTFAFDFLAYHQAAGRVLAGEPLYDTTVQQTGGFGLFYYPPPFVLAILPLAVLPPSVAAVVWLALLVAAFLGAIALLPVRAGVKWAVLLLAAASWPVAYTFKLGQVGPLLMLAFVAAWRGIDEPRVLGTSAAAGAIVKLQPGLLLVWAALTGRWRGAALGAATGAAACLVATVVVGVGAWWDYALLLRQVSDPITTPHNFTPGAVAFQLGASPAAGAAVQVAVSVLVVVALVVAARRAPSHASFLVAVVASQLLSPVLWDHYALLLLVPVAWLLDRGVRWAAIVPIATSVFTLGLAPPVVYPLAFAGTLLAVLVLGLLEGRPGAAVQSQAG